MKIKQAYFWIGLILLGAGIAAGYFLRNNEKPIRTELTQEEKDRINADALIIRLAHQYEPDILEQLGCPPWRQELFRVKIEPDPDAELQQTIRRLKSYSR